MVRIPTIREMQLARIAFIIDPAAFDEGVTMTANVRDVSVREAFEKAIAVLDGMPCRGECRA